MKIVVVSDNHRDTVTLAQILEREKESNLWIHCGDSQFDKGNSLLEKFTVVQGNTDHAFFQKEQVIECENVKVLVSHGHLYHIDFTIDEIVASAQMQGATVALHGHTHIPRDVFVDGVRVINPGSTSWPRGHFHFGTYAILETYGKDDVMEWNTTFISTQTWLPIMLK